MISKGCRLGIMAEKNSESVGNVPLVKAFHPGVKTTDPCRLIYAPREISTIHNYNYRKHHAIQH